jgi:flagellar biosynthetic protein FlhB
MGEDSGEKTEEPTPHKLQEARKKGQIAKSKDLTSAILLMVSFFTLKAWSSSIWENLTKFMHEVFNYIPLEFSPDIAGHLLLESLKLLFLLLGPIFAANYLTALIMELLQTGFLISAGPLEPKLEKLNPIEGFKKFFTLKQYVELFKSMVKMIIVILLITTVIKEEIFMVIISSQLSLWQVMAFTGGLAAKIITRVGIFYFFIAILDYFYQRYEFNKSMKMSKKEIKDEYKRLEGDPLIKQRQRDAQRQMAQSRQMGAVPQADVVVTNPIHLAIAISYQAHQMKAPKVVAKGKRLVAHDIRRIAEEHRIPIIENPPLARALFPVVEVDTEIPPDFYKAVAEILAFVYNLKKKRSPTLRQR